jgi:hypothetical protein
MTNDRRPRPDDPREASASSDKPGGGPEEPFLSEAEFYGRETPRSEAHYTALWEFPEEASLGVDDFAPENPARVRSVVPETPATRVREADAPIAIIPVAAAARRLTPLVQSWTLALGIITTVAIVIALPTTFRTTVTNDIPAQTIAVVPVTTPTVRSQAVTSSFTLAVSRTAVEPTSSRIAVTVPSPTIQKPVPADILRVETRIAMPPAAPIQKPVPAETLRVETRIAMPPAATIPAPVATLAVTEPPLPVARADPPARVSEPAIAPVKGSEDEREIRLLLDAYRQSYHRLDPVSTAMLWPGVDTAALTRAFSAIASQQIEFQQCALDVLGARATARCNGSLQYVPRVGSAEPQSRSLSWAFELNRNTGRWLISRVSAQ